MSQRHRHCNNTLWMNYTCFAFLGVVVLQWGTPIVRTPKKTTTRPPTKSRDSKSSRDVFVTILSLEKQFD